MFVNVIPQKNHGVQVYRAVLELALQFSGRLKKRLHQQDILLFYLKDGPTFVQVIEQQPDIVLSSQSQEIPDRVVKGTNVIAVNQLRYVSRSANLDHRLLAF